MYVRRNQQNEVVAVFASSQAGIAEELLADDHADIAAFRDPPAARKAAAIAEIDRQAEAARLRFITDGAGQAAVYLAKSNEADRYALDGSPDAGDYPLMAASIGIEGETLADVVAIVVATRAGWLTAAAAIEAARLGAKAAVAALSDPPDREDIDTILAGISWPSPA